MANTKTLTQEDVARLKQLVQQGCQVLQEVEDLRDSLNATIKAMAEEMDIKPANLKKAVTMAHNSNFSEHQADLAEIEDILDITGRKV